MKEVSPPLLKAKDVDGDGSDDDRLDGRVPSLSTLMSWVPSASKEKVLGRNRREIRCSHTMIDTTCGSWEWRRCISQQ